MSLLTYQIGRYLFVSDRDWVTMIRLFDGRAMTFSIDQFLEIGRQVQDERKCKSDSPFNRTEQQAIDNG